MSRKKLDSKLSEAFEEMEDQDIEIAMASKEKIWNTLQVNKKKKKKVGGWFWFCLGLLLAIGGMFVKHWTIDTPQSPKIPIAETQKPNALESKLNEMEAKILALDTKYANSIQQIDSLTLSNQELKNQLSDLRSANRLVTAKNASIQYVSDTIYLTKYETEIIEREKIIRDTVMIEVPVFQEEEELMTEASAHEDVKNPSKPTSIQFNFKRVKTNK